MPIDDVWARPDRLRQFRETAGGLADGLTRRWSGLEAAIAAYRARTESSYETDTAGAAEGVHAIGRAIRELGAWVGEVGDAFDRLPGAFGSPHVGPYDVLLQGLPAALRLGSGGAAVVAGGGPWGGLGPTVGSAASRGADPEVLRSIAVAVTRDAAGPLAQATDGSESRRSPARILDLLGVADTGIREGAHRWSTEADREAPARVARATLDGLLAAGGTWGGASIGTELAVSACALVMTPLAAPACGPAGGFLGGRAGRAVAEEISDAFLGDEPEPWERDGDRLAEEVGDVDADAVEAVEPVLAGAEAEATAAADRHNDFVVDHPWLWDDAYHDAPHHEPPAPGPALPIAGAT